MKYLILFILLTFIFILFIILNKRNEYFTSNHKINYIDKIVWINLDRSSKRKDYMNQLLKSTPVQNQRISGIDGNKINVQNIINDLLLGKKMSFGEIGCTLSHIKAINSLKNEPGNYFMVCEDDISFDHLKYFNKTLKNIIEESPTFDILMINKIYTNEINDTYVSWKDYYQKNKKIWGTACYIISKKGINKLIKICKYIDDNHFIFNKKLNNTFDVADFYLYNLLDTWVYKYNFINSKDESSTIHNNHLNYHDKSNKFNLELIKRDINQL